MVAFEQLTRKTGKLSVEELDDYFERLEPVTVAEMFGEWQVGYFLTEETLCILDVFIRIFPIFKIYGKRFFSQNKVKAWIYSFCGVKFSIPFASAVLRNVEFRNKISTSMIYNYMPMIDHLRKVDQTTVMGVMEIKGRVSLYFYLLREKQI